MDDPAYLRCFRYCGLLCRQAGGQPTSANTILKMITNDFKREGTVEGSWIDHQPIPYRQFAVRTLVYRGGIRRFEDDQLVSYEFLADASTGTLLKLKRIDN
ncbi:hypothetical protein SAMN05216430_105135 [Limosilactobacillus mucosae]|nr:hypothetical protein SAMN05216430_105135 [Limosilactobacillus mucosae]SEK84784.1 hypothetical protein SAMN05216545_105135 [Limosilactobacillus mucosae]SFK10555.1 hypothetical protein SAMN05216461_10516 [Limosilactobacillus mucosae]